MVYPTGKSTGEKKGFKNMLDGNSDVLSMVNNLVRLLSINRYN
jgi:hypothetical protein